jgi:hypothetical protein
VTNNASILRCESRPWPLQVRPRRRRADLSPPATSVVSAARSGTTSASSLCPRRSPSLLSPGSQRPSSSSSIPQLNLQELLRRLFVLAGRR